MAKQLIPEELDLLIQECLTDGVITAKEREVILRKAEKLGLDRDEIDLYLDAQVQKIDQAYEQAVRNRKGILCPYCEESVPPFTDKCPACGKTITPEATEELEKLLKKMEHDLEWMKTCMVADWASNSTFVRYKSDLENDVRRAKMYYRKNPTIQLLLAEIDEELKIANKSERNKVEPRSVKHPTMLTNAKGSITNNKKIVTNKWVWISIFGGIILSLIGIPMVGLIGVICGLFILYQLNKKNF